MSRKQRHTPEQVIGKRREAEVKLAKSTAIAQVCKDLSITQETASDCSTWHTSSNPRWPSDNRRRRPSGPGPMDRAASRTGRGRVTMPPRATRLPTVAAPPRLSHD